MIDRSLPLTDLHRHLDGNIRPQTILELGRQHNIRLPADELEALRPHVQIVENEPSLVAFLKKLDWGVAVLADYEACRRVAYENVEDLLHAGIDYAELRFSPAYMAMAHKLHPQGVVEAIIDGVAAGRLHDRHAACFQECPQRAHLTNAIAEILFIEHFFEPQGHRLQITSG